MKRLLAAAVLAVSLHVLIFSLGDGRLSRHPPVWQQPPVTVLLAGLSRRAVSGVTKTAVQMRKQRPLKPKQVTSHHVTTKTKKLSRKAPEPHQKHRLTQKPKTTPRSLNTASGRQSINPSLPPSAELPPALSRAGSSARPPVSRKSLSTRPGHNPNLPAAASTLQMATPLYWRNPPPRYPALARRRHYTGTVILEVLVNNKGLVSKLRVVGSSGYLLLDEAALAAVRQWQFAPGTEGGRPTAMRVKVPIRFRLR
ncbi:energy transducer TonB [Desulfobacterota bacterium M19]